jgi:hypothetical protein
MRNRKTDIKRIVARTRPECRTFVARGRGHCLHIPTRGRAENVRRCVEVAFGMDICTTFITVSQAIYCQDSPVKEFCHGTVKHKSHTGQEFVRFSGLIETGKSRRKGSSPLETHKSRSSLNCDYILYKASSDCWKTGNFPRCIKHTGYSRRWYHLEQWFSTFFCSWPSSEFHSPLWPHPSYCLIIEIIFIINMYFINCTFYL